VSPYLISLLIALGVFFLGKFIGKRFGLSPNSYLGFAIISFVLAFICYKEGRETLLKPLTDFPFISNEMAICSVIGLCGISIVLIFFANRKNLFLRKDLEIEKEPKSYVGIKFKAYATDENTKLVIRSLGTAKHGFKNFSDIVTNTNLSLDTINHILDWLVTNKLATETNGRRGKIYELLPKGRKMFSHIINPKN